MGVPLSCGKLKQMNEHSRKTVFFFLCFVHFPEAPCSVRIRLQGHISLYLLFLISVMKWGSPVFLSSFSEPESKTLGRKVEKNHNVTSEKC